jgi:hypothetical protein
MLYKRLFSLCLRRKNAYGFFFSFIHVIYFPHLMLRRSVILMVISAEYTSHCVSLWNLLLPPVTSPLSAPSSTAHCFKASLDLCSTLTWRLERVQVQMFAGLNTISEWFRVNSLSRNLNKTFYGIKVFRMHKCIVRIVMGCKRRESCRHLFRKLKILPLPSQCILTLLLFVINNRNQFTINS